MHHKSNILFFVDAMLGNVARKLRLLGYDSKYFADITDENLINAAKEENRIIISRDEALVKKSQKIGMKPIFITKDDEMEQFYEILDHVDLDVFQINGNTARCPKCNSTTEHIDRISIKDMVPKNIYEKNEKFWKCKKCDKLYWEGTHIRNLQKFTGELNERLR